MRTLFALLLLSLLPQAAPPAAEVRQAFLKQLDRPRVPFDPAAPELKEEGGLVYETFSIATEKKPDGAIERMPVLLVRPAAFEGRLPAVAVLHGTGGNKESQKGWCANLARRGIIGVAIDARYHGARSGGGTGSAAYVEAITRAWRSKTPEGEHPFYYDTVWDLWRLADYLQTRADVDPARLGMIGFSMGGIQAWLAASVDERWKACVPAIAVQSFKWSLENERWQGRANTIKAAHEAAAADLGEARVNQKVCRALWSKVIPGILDSFDCPSLIRLFAGRPLLIVNGDQDPNCPVEGARIAIAAAEAAYKEAGCPEKLQVMIAEGVGHKVTLEQTEAALGFLVKHLK